jgi:hypothetical protein
MTLDSIMETVAKTLEVAEAELTSSARAMRLANARSIICYMAYLSGSRGVEVAARLNISGSGVTVAARRGNGLIKNYPELAALVN